MMRRRRLVPLLMILAIGAGLAWWRARSTPDSAMPVHRVGDIVDSDHPDPCIDDVSIDDVFIDSVSAHLTDEFD